MLGFNSESSEALGTVDTEVLRVRTEGDTDRLLL